MDATCLLVVWIVDIVNSELQLGSTEQIVIVASIPDDLDADRLNKDQRVGDMIK